MMISPGEIRGFFLLAYFEVKQALDIDIEYLQVY